MERREIVRVDAAENVGQQSGRHLDAVAERSGAAESLRCRVEQRVIEIVRDYYNLPPHESLTGETLFAQDLGADSLDSMEILMAIEEEYDIVLGDHLSLQELKSIRSASDLLASKLQTA